MKDKKINVILTIVSLVVAVLIGEGMLHIFFPFENLVVGVGEEMPWMESLSKEFTVDPDFGFRPILGTRHYSEYGILKFSTYKLKKRLEVSRILFIGDSVTQRGNIARAIEYRYGEEKYEWWNAGVESFNTVQEVKYYKKYNRKIKPDHVILTFHNNDLETTPVAFFNQDNELVSYMPQAYVNQWLFRNSRLYLLAFKWRLDREEAREEIARGVRDSLSELKKMTDEDGTKLTVLVLPILSPYDQWNEKEKLNYGTALKILKILNIRYFDFLPISEKAINDGVDLQEEEGDTWHPSKAVSTRFAIFLQENNLLP